MGLSQQPRARLRAWAMETNQARRNQQTRARLHDNLLERVAERAGQSEIATIRALVTPAHFAMAVARWLVARSRAEALALLAENAAPPDGDDLGDELTRAIYRQLQGARDQEANAPTTAYMTAEAPARPETQAEARARERAALARLGIEAPE